METLRFTQRGQEFVSDRIAGASQINLHLNFELPEGLSSAISVERTLDSDTLGWACCAQRRANDIYEESIVGIPAGTDIRIRSSVRPTVAKYTFTAQE